MDEYGLSLQDILFMTCLLCETPLRADYLARQTLPIEKVLAVKMHWVGKPYILQTYWGPLTFFIAPPNDKAISLLSSSSFFDLSYTLPIFYFPRRPHDHVPIYRFYNKKPSKEEIEKAHRLARTFLFEEF